MKFKISVAIWALSLVFCVALALAGPRKNSETSVSTRSVESDTMRIEGEKRYRANCGRCHAAPQKFKPRMMATVVRHMRVRATITDEDMRLVLYYMTQ